MAAIDRKKAWRIIQPLIANIIKRQVDDEEYQLSVAKEKGFSYESLRKQTTIPIRLALWEELPEILNRELEAKC